MLWKSAKANQMSPRYDDAFTIHSLSQVSVPTYTPGTNYPQNRLDQQGTPRKPSET